MSAVVRPVVAVLLSILVALGLGAPSDAAPSPSPSSSGVPAPDAAKDPAKVGFGIGPVTNGTLGDRSLFSHGIPPGGSVNDNVGVVNYSTQPLTLEVYAADAMNTQDGSFATVARSEPKRDLAAWIAIGDGSTEVTVPGRDAAGQPGMVVLPLVISVPKDAAPGDHAAGVLAVLVTQSKDANGKAIRLEQRVAAQVFINVPGTATPGLVVEGLTGEYADALLPWQGRSRVVADVVNSGNVRLGVKTTVSVAGPFGWGRKNVTLPKINDLLPHQGQSVDTTVAGTWPLLFTTVTVEALPSPGTAMKTTTVDSLSVVTASATVIAWSWWYLVLLLLLALALTRRSLSRRLRARRRRQRRSRLAAASPGGAPDVVEAPTRASRRAMVGSGKG